MPQITKVLPNQGPNNDRIYVYIDNNFCTSIRKRTWIGMSLTEGSQISCEELKKLENNFWKQLYGASSWRKEKYRISRVIAWFKKYIPEIQVEVTGFGAGSTEIIEDKHSQKKGAPDLCIKYLGQTLVFLEVSGTERKKGEDFWVRKDKIDYIQANRQEDVWIILHYQLPKEQFIWLKIDHQKKYLTQKINVKGAEEYYIIFTPHDREITSSQHFKDCIIRKISSLAL